MLTIIPETRQRENEYNRDLSVCLPNQSSLFLFFVLCWYLLLEETAAAAAYSSMCV